MINVKTLFRYVAYVVLPASRYARFIGVSIGERCLISTKQWGSEPYLIEIGDDVHVSRGVRFINHDGGVWIFRKENPNFDIFGKIRIGDNCYIGNHAIILPGVTIGNRCVIGANSVVTKCVPDNSVVAGNPARLVSTVEQYYQKASLLNTDLKNDIEKKDKLLRLDESRFIVKGSIS